MKHLCVVTLLFLCVLPVFLWPMEESWHPLPAALVEEGFEVAGRHRRAVRSSPTTVATNSRKTSGKGSAPTHRKGSTIPHQTGKKPTPSHHSQPENKRKARENHPTKPGKKLVLHHHRQKSYKKSTETKVH